MTIDVARDGRIAIVTLNRPEAHNALTPEDLATLMKTLLELDADAAVNVIIVTGAGPKAFCAGADLSRVVDTTATAAEMALAGGDRPLVRDPGVAKPLIAAVNGHALGGGLELALICDIRVASTNATFGLPEVAVGSLPGSGGTQRLQRVVAPGVALHLALTGERIDAAEAYRIGLVTRLVAPEKLMDEALAIARKIDGNAPLSVRAVKQAVRAGQDMGLTQGLAFERQLFNLLRFSADRLEGRQAFREKRPAEVRGTLAMSLSNRFAIAGVGATAQGKLPGRTALDLGIEAFGLALNDAGLQQSDVDGLLTMPGTTSPEGSLHYLRFGEAIGIDPRFTASLDHGRRDGRCAASRWRRSRSTPVRRPPSPASSATRRRPAAALRPRQRRRGALVGLGHDGRGREQRARRRPPHARATAPPRGNSAEVAVACRQHASINPDAVMREPITVEDHQASRWIVRPLQLLDCCLISDGGVCLIVTSAERARDLKQPPVLHGRHGPGLHRADAGGRALVVRAAPEDRADADAFRMAGVGAERHRRGAALRQLHHLGAALARARRLLRARARAAPSSRAGASGSAATCRSTPPAAISPRATWRAGCTSSRACGRCVAQCGPRQVPDVEHCLVTGRGMALNCANALVLRRG